MVYAIFDSFARFFVDLFKGAAKGKKGKGGGKKKKKKGSRKGVKKKKKRSA